MLWWSSFELSSPVRGAAPAFLNIPPRKFSLPFLISGLSSMFLMLDIPQDRLQVFLGVEIRSYSRVHELEVDVDEEALV